MNFRLIGLFVTVSFSVTSSHAFIPPDIANKTLDFFDSLLQSARYFVNLVRPKTSDSANVNVPPPPNNLKPLQIEIRTPENINLAQTARNFARRGIAAIQGPPLTTNTSFSVKSNGTLQGSKATPSRSTLVNPQSKPANSTRNINSTREPTTTIPTPATLSKTAPVPAAPSKA